MALRLANNATSKLALGITSTSTTLYVLPGEGAKFPALVSSDWFPLVLVKADGTNEILRCTARTDDAFTVQRAQEGTAAEDFAAGDRVELRMTAGAASGIGTNLQDGADVATPDVAGTLNKVANLQAVYQILDILEPVGTVKYWDSDGAPPPGFFVCNGLNGTPDWSGKFIMVPDAEHARGATGGAASVTLAIANLPAHSHAGTTGSNGEHTHSVAGTAASAGEHAHSVDLHSGGWNANGMTTGGETTYRKSINTGSAGVHSHVVTGTAFSAGAHTHDFTTSSVGSGTAHENRPPFVAIPIIRKMVTALSTIS